LICHELLMAGTTAAFIGLPPGAIPYERRYAGMHDFTSPTADCTHKLRLTVS
jgi:hypothetical protein